MATEEKIRELAYTMWEQEGRPTGKDQEHYYRARKTLEDKEAAAVIHLPSSPGPAQSVPPYDKRNFGRHGRR